MREPAHKSTTRSMILSLTIGKTKPLQKKVRRVIVRRVSLCKQVGVGR